MTADGRRPTGFVVGPCLHWLLLAACCSLITVLAACDAAILQTPPRLATATAQAESEPSATPTPYLSAAPTPTGTLGPLDFAIVGEATPNPSLTLWVDETSAAHREMLQRLADQFSQEHNVHVEVVQVVPELLPGLMQTAVLSDTLPDLVFHPVEYTMGWLERGILDAEAATEVIEQLGRDTFDPDALTMATNDGQVAAVPSDGWQLLVIYRADWFTQRDLAPPITFTALISAAEAISDTANLVNGFVVPTEADLVTTQYIFEQMAAANGCRLVDEKGEIFILEPACLEALTFYRQIVNIYSPSGVQTDLSTLNAYLAGRTGLIMASPDVLPVLAGLDTNAQPTCPECNTAGFLAQNSGILTEIEGSGPLATPVNFGTMHLLGITTAANREAALAFATFWFEEGYPQWLAVEPERKVPMRWGTAAEPRRFMDAWFELPLAESDVTLSDVYGRPLAEQLSRGIASSPRWGYAQGQGALITTIYEELTLSILLQEMLSGYFTSDQSIVEAYARITDLIPNYPYLIELTPTPTPDG